MDDEMIECKQEFIVLAIPSSTVEVEIEATIWQDGKSIKVGRKLGFEEVRAAIKDAQECYWPSDTLFTLTDLGRAELESLKERYRHEEDE